MKTIHDMILQMREIKNVVKGLQHQMFLLEFTGKSNKAEVSITLDGYKHMTQVHIDPTLLVPDAASQIGDLIQQAYHRALAKIDAFLDNHVTQSLKDKMTALQRPF